MRNKKLLIHFTVCCLFAACSKHDKLSCPHFDVSSPVEATPCEVFSSVEVIPLTMPEGIYTSSVRSFFSIGDKYIVKDKRDIVYLFSADGHYISLSEKKKGRGHGEYTNMLDFTYNPYSKYIEITTPNYLVFYDTLFNHVKSVPLPTKWPEGREDGFFYGRVFDLSPSLHLLLPSFQYDERFLKICIFDSETGEITKNIPYSRHCIYAISMQARCFYKMDDGKTYFFPPCLSECSYIFDTEALSITPYLSLDFGERGFDAELIRNISKKDNETRANFMLDYGKDMPMTFLPLGESLIVVVKNGKRLEDVYTQIVNLRSGKSTAIKLFQKEKKVFPLLSDASEDGVLALVESNEVEDYLEQFAEENVFGRDRPIDPDGYAILKYKLK